MISAVAALGGVVAGFVLSEVAGWVRRRAGARSSIAVAWYELADIEERVRMLVFGYKFAPDSDAASLEFPRRAELLAEAQHVMSQDEVAVVARVLGRGSIMTTHYQKLWQFRMSRGVRPDQLPPKLNAEAVDPMAELKLWHGELLTVGRLLDSRRSLTWRLWLRHPGRALRHRRHIRTVASEEKARVRRGLEARRAAESQSKGESNGPDRDSEARP